MMVRELKRSFVLNLKYSKSIFRKLGLFSILVLLPAYYSAQTDTVKLLLKTFDIEALNSYLIPSEYAKKGDFVYGDATHIFFLNNSWLNNIDGFHYKNRIVLLEDLNEGNIANSRVHFRVDSLSIASNRAYMKISAILTRGLLILHQDVGNSEEIWSSWPKEQTHHLTMEVIFKKGLFGWHIKRYETEHQVVRNLKL